MSGFDDLYAAVLAERARLDQGHAEAGQRVSVTPLEALDIRRIGAALDRARREEGKPIPEHYALPDYPGSSTWDLRLGGKPIGGHRLIGATGRQTYVAETSCEGAAPALCIEPRRLLRRTRDDIEAGEAWGPEQPLGAKAFDRRFIVRCRSRRAVDAFLTDDVVWTLADVKGDLVAVTVRAHEGRTQVEVKVEVDGSPAAAPAVALARAAHAAAARLASAPGGFGDDGATSDGLDPTVTRALVEQLRESTSFLAGLVERVGDGVEARFELDKPEGLACVFRLEQAEERTVRATLRGRLAAPSPRTAKLSAEVGALARARGLLDPKLGDPALDRAFLIEGDLATARHALRDPTAALRLVGRGATLAVDAEGFSVVVPPFAANEAAILEVTAACIAAWRAAALANAGFADSEP